jgi:cysteine-rich repeat protein
MVDQGEECDGGNYCDARCKNINNPYCGNGTLDSEEECDDGNTTDGDRCSASCKKESGYCGDGGEDPGEECDDGNTKDGDGCDALCIKECQDDGLGSNFLMSEFLGFGKKCDKPVGCPHDEPNVRNYEAGTNDDGYQCKCDNELDFYKGAMWDGSNKPKNSCKCDNYYFPKDGECVQECKNGLNKVTNPDCKCPNFGDSVKNGECVPHSLGRIILTCVANLGIHAGGKACGVGWFIPLPGIGTDGKVSMRPSRSPMS